MHPGGQSNRLGIWIYLSSCASSQGCLSWEVPAHRSLCCLLVLEGPSLLAPAQCHRLAGVWLKASRDLWEIRHTIFITTFLPSVRQRPLPPKTNLRNKFLDHRDSLSSALVGYLLHLWLNHLKAYQFNLLIIDPTCQWLDAGSFKLVIFTRKIFFIERSQLSY